MSTPDPNNVLFKIAHPDLYERNPFNVLNLPVDATAKDIRRRKEDIEAAFDAGTERTIFQHILPEDRTRDVPSHQFVEMVFGSLENPEERLAWELFWYWDTPDIALPKTDRGPVACNPNSRITEEQTLKWMKQALTTRGTSAAIALHNSAINQHMISFDIENRLASGRDIRPTPDFIDGFWKRAILFWNHAVSNDDVWHHLVDRVEALNDPRVSYKTIRRFRDQFPFAFDQINAELAIEYAKCNRGADARRQVQYMKLSQPGSDDVEGTFDDAFAGLLRQTEAIVKTTRDEAQKNPKDGLKKANELLSQTAEPLHISRIVFDGGEPIRDAIVTTIFKGARSCLIAYGNATRDWVNCLTLTRKLKLLAESEQHKNQIIEDERIIQRIVHGMEHERSHGHNQAPQSNNQTQETKSSGNKAIELFHCWCKNSEKVFPLAHNMSREQKISTAQVLFQDLSKDVNNHDDVYELLQLLQNEDKQSVEPGKRMDFSVGLTGRTFGCYIRSAPNREVYLAGYNFLSMIHFQQHPYHNVSVANHLLLEALRKEKLILCSVNSGGGSEGYQTAHDKTAISMYVRKQSYWGLWKTYSELAVVVRMEALVPRSKEDLISIRIVQPDDQRKAWKEAHAVAKRANDQFRLRGLNLSLVRGKDVNEVILCLSSLVQQLLSDLINCIRERKCDVAGNEWPNAPRSWKWTETVPVL